MVSQNSYFSKTLEKGLKILALFNRDIPALSQTEIAKKTGVNMTSTYRYINTLVEMGYLDKDESTKLIRPSIFCLAFCYNLMRATDYRHLIKTIVDDIYNRCNMTIDVALCVDDNMMRVYHREAADTLTYSLPDFTRNCLHNTALGKAYLSSLPEDKLSTRIDQLQLTSKTAHTIINQDTLHKELVDVKRRGYAMNIEEYLPGLIAIAAPLISPLNHQGIGAVSFDFSVLQQDSAEIEELYAQMIVDLAAKISTTIPLDGKIRS